MCLEQQSWQKSCTAHGHGMVSAQLDLDKLEGFLHRCKWTGYCVPDMLTITEQMNNADDKFFCNILQNQHHVLQYLLADNPDLMYHLQPRKHNKTLISKSNGTLESFLSKVAVESDLQRENLQE